MAKPPPKLELGDDADGAGPVMSWQTRLLPLGSIVTLITPLDHPDGKIDYACIDALIEWHLACGTVGFFSPCLSSEMFDLTPMPRQRLPNRRCRALLGS